MQLDFNAKAQRCYQRRAKLSSFSNPSHKNEDENENDDEGLVGRQGGPAFV